MEIFNALFGGGESNEDKEAREYQEMMDRVNADAERRANKAEGRKASDDYLRWKGSTEKLEYELDLENKKVAKNLGWKEPKKETPKERKLIATDTGLGDDGYMYYYYNYNNGDVEQKRM